MEPSVATAGAVPSSSSGGPGYAADATENPEEEHMLERFTWFRQSAMRFAGDGLTVYIDPWGTVSQDPPADVIFITHAHTDHFQPQEIERLSRSTTKRDRLSWGSSLWRFDARERAARRAMGLPWATSRGSGLHTRRAEAGQGFSAGEARRRRGRVQRRRLVLPCPPSRAAS